MKSTFTVKSLLEEVGLGKANKEIYLDVAFPFKFDSFGKLTFSRELEPKLFPVYLKERDCETVPTLVEKVTVEMRKEGYCLATLGDLIYFLSQNKRHIARDEDSLNEVDKLEEIIALGSICKFEGISVAPFFHIDHYSLGSSIDRDLSFHQRAQITYMFLEETKKWGYNILHSLEFHVNKPFQFLGVVAH